MKEDIKNVNIIKYKMSWVNIKWSWHHMMFIFPVVNVQTINNNKA